MLAQHRRRKAAREATEGASAVRWRSSGHRGRVTQCLPQCTVQNAVDRVSASSTSELPVVPRPPRRVCASSRASSPAAPTRSLGPSPSASMHPSHPAVPAPALPSRQRRISTAASTKGNAAFRRQRRAAPRPAAGIGWCRRKPVQGRGQAGRTQVVDMQVPVADQWGNPHHDSACLRKQFRPSTVSAVASVRQIVRACRQHGRAGKRFRCERVDRSGWVPVPDWVSR